MTPPAWELAAALLAGSFVGGFIGAYSGSRLYWWSLSRNAQRHKARQRARGRS